MLQFRVKVTSSFEVKARGKIEGHDLEGAENSSERWEVGPEEIVLETREVGQPDPLFYRKGKAIPLPRSEIWNLFDRGYLLEIC